MWLAEQGLTVTTTDIAPRAIQKALALAERRGVALDAQLADLETWAWPQDAFDVVAAVFIQFAPPAQRDRIFQRMKAAVKSNGLILLQGYRPEQIAYGTGDRGRSRTSTPRRCSATPLPTSTSCIFKATTATCPKAPATAAGPP